MLAKCVIMTHVSDATINCCDTLQQLWSVCLWISASSPANWWTSSRVIKRICLQIPTFVWVVTEALQRLVVHVEPKDKEYSPDVPERGLCDAFGLRRLTHRTYSNKSSASPFKRAYLHSTWKNKNNIMSRAIVWWCNDDISTILLYYDLVNN